MSIQNLFHGVISEMSDFVLYHNMFAIKAQLLDAQKYSRWNELRGLNIFGRFSAMFYKGEIFLLPVCFPVHQSSSEKMSTSKGKNLLPVLSPLKVNSFPAVGDFCLLLINFANSLDPDQAWQNVGPDLDPNCLTLWWYSWKIFLKKLILKKFTDDKKAELPSLQRVNLLNLYPSLGIFSSWQIHDIFLITIYIHRQQTVLKKWLETVFFICHFK